MSAHLLLMTIGPVQSFIAQARRTRDLWFGSHVLSELSKTAVQTLADTPGLDFIFPVLPSDKQKDTGLPNKLLVRLSEGDPRALARKAREAVRTRLSEWGLEQWHEHHELVDDASLATAKEQLDTLIEFQAAWTQYSSEAEYEKALARVEKAIAGRKRLHAFTPWLHQRGGIHKSSLDGARESVLRPMNPRKGKWARFRIGLREQLDAIGLLKRTGGKPGQFVPVPSIGLSAFIEHAEATCKTEFPKLLDACKGLKQMAPEAVSGVDVRGREWVRRFPYDAQLLLPDRWQTLLDEEGVSAESGTDFYASHVRPILKEAGEPYPYVVCLSADGDKMGKALEALAPKGHEAHQALSRALTKFALEARSIVEEHDGVLVYAGGDDVLAFVALPNALACASKLRASFMRILRDVVEEPPTLSVGLGIGHVLESLGDLLDLGRRAEKLAKGAEPEARDGLGIVARLRAGRLHTWRARWSSEPGALALLEQAFELRREGTLPLKKLQDVEGLARRFPRPTDEKDALYQDTRMGGVLAREVRRVLKRTDMGGGDDDGLQPERVGLDLKTPLPLGEVQKRVSSWVARVWVAEMFSRAEPGARDDGVAKEVS
ncbi:type III-B CRISPR-associated protein Cas10/Cmr2 [Myxococcus sp. K15C18031901]|uniref:type III-B CRISPR-associated protein Cas10/Cmr2 n=1 Tax=Myxococcus dinghuensis TaxID=2906761 RepID=UPI0020A7E526|nr:type III-B CRISPR-associated protein Cas10/Cmr2 [Myxococcus dinghuensis]MCP3103973.1 type III-B CRISPR-associated protein Cas10/Cmr2 [Myxococcus dinghuensis]